MCVVMQAFDKVGGVGNTKWLAKKSVDAAFTHIDGLHLEASMELLVQKLLGE